MAYLTSNRYVWIFSTLITARLRSTTGDYVSRAYVCPQGGGTPWFLVNWSLDLFGGYPWPLVLSGGTPWPLVRGPFWGYPSQASSWGYPILSGGVPRQDPLDRTGVTPPDSTGIPPRQDRGYPQCGQAMLRVVHLFQSRRRTFFLLPAYVVQQEGNSFTLLVCPQGGAVQPGGSGPAGGGVRSRRQGGGQVQLARGGQVQPGGEGQVQPVGGGVSQDRTTE